MMTERPVQSYVYRKVPYSAYFYFGDRVVPHAKEDGKLSEEASRRLYLLGRKDDLTRYPLAKPRPLLLENGVWILYGPEE